MGAPSLYVDRLQQQNTNKSYKYLIMSSISVHFDNKYLQPALAK